MTKASWATGEQNEMTEKQQKTLKLITFNGRVLLKKTTLKTKKKKQ